MKLKWVNYSIGCECGVCVQIVLFQQLKRIARYLQRNKTITCNYDKASTYTMEKKVKINICTLQKNNEQAEEEEKKNAADKFYNFIGVTFLLDFSVPVFFFHASAPTQRVKMCTVKM